MPNEFDTSISESSPDSIATGESSPQVDTVSTQGAEESALPPPSFKPEPAPVPRRDRLRKRDATRLEEQPDGSIKVFRGDREMKGSGSTSNEANIVKENNIKLAEEFSVFNPSYQQASPDSILKQQEPAMDDDLASSPPAGSDPNKRDKDTQAAYTRSQQDLKRAQEQIHSYSQREEEVKQVLSRLVTAAQRNPQLFQQLFNDGQPQTTSAEEFAEAAQNDPDRFRKLIQQEVQNQVPQFVAKEPVIAESRNKEAARKYFQEFVKTTFGGNVEHPELVAATPYLTALAREYQKLGKFIPIDEAWANYQAQKQVFAASKGQSGGANSKTTSTSNVTPPESTPNQNTRPLPSKYPGVAGRTVGPENRRSALDGLSRKEKVERLGEQLFGEMVAKRRQSR